MTDLNMITDKDKDVTVEHLKYMIADGNNEYAHKYYDVLIKRRLQELDPEYVKMLDGLGEFELWFA